MPIDQQISRIILQQLLELVTCCNCIDHYTSSNDRSWLRMKLVGPWCHQVHTKDSKACHLQLTMQLNMFM